MLREKKRKCLCLRLVPKTWLYLNYCMSNDLSNVALLFQEAFFQFQFLILNLGYWKGETIFCTKTCFEMIKWNNLIFVYNAHIRNTVDSEVVCFEVLTNWELKLPERCWSCSFNTLKEQDLKFQLFFFFFFKPNSSHINQRSLYFPQVHVQQKVSGQHTFLPRQSVTGFHHLLWCAQRRWSGHSTATSSHHQRAEVSQQRGHSRCCNFSVFFFSFKTFFLVHNQNSFKLFKLKLFLEVLFRQSEPSDHPQRCLDVWVMVDSVDKDAAIILWVWFLCVFFLQPWEVSPHWGPGPPGVRGATVGCAVTRRAQGAAVNQGPWTPLPPAQVGDFHWTLT